ncbi:hypothetical protein LPJ53_004219 [Coemansia erecta]|uniref:Uncharacterized protein n=1 Tax=Coemansia erecta TaxID=147472 RepID=A0A9W7XY93_9FUNG|nr:hypothetical protein LPJ53_004219 [Coemansia erecta]
MKFTIAIPVLAYSTIVSAKFHMLHPRADADAAPSDLGFILNNVADLVADPSLMSEVGAAATSLMEAAGQPGYDEMANAYLSTLLASVEASNDPQLSSQMAAAIVSLLQSANDIPEQVAEPYSSLVSALKDPEIASDAADILKVLINFISSVHSLMPEAFEDFPTDETATGESDTQDSSSNTQSSTQHVTKSSTDEDSTTKSSKESESSGNDDNESDDMDSSTSGAARNGSVVVGLFSVGIAASVVSVLF